MFRLRLAYVDARRDDYLMPYNKGNALLKICRTAVGLTIL